MKLVNKVEPKAKLKYNKFYIGLEVDGSPRNVVRFTPTRSHVITEIKLPETPETDQQLDDADIERMKYDPYGRYRLRLVGAIDDKQRDVLLGLIRQAWEKYRE